MCPFQAVVLAVGDDVGVRTVMQELLSAMINGDMMTRAAASAIMNSYRQNTRNDFTE